MFAHGIYQARSPQEKVDRDQKRPVRLSIRSFHLLQTVRSWAGDLGEGRTLPMETAMRGLQDWVTPDIEDIRCEDSSAFPGSTTNEKRTSKVLPGVTPLPWSPGAALLGQNPIHKAGCRRGQFRQALPAYTASWVYYSLTAQTVFLVLSQVLLYATCAAGIWYSF